MSSTPSASNTNKTFSVTPSVNLSSETSYKIRVTTLVKDVVGNSMSNSYTTSNGFTSADITSPILSQVTAITTPTNDNTSSYTFSSTEAGTITYGGSCSSDNTSATTDNNTVTFNALADGTYNNCTITVTDSASNASSTLDVNTFVVDTTAPVIAEVTAVTTPTNDKTPNYTFSSTEAGTITYGGSCSSSTTSATTDNNTITFSTLDNGTHSNCIIKVTDSAVNVSNTLEITDFTVSYWKLIARQVDSDNFTDGTNELFLDNASTTYLQNEDNSSSSTFMSIGNLNKSYYVDNGTYKFKLVWDGMQVDNLTIKEVTWTQTSWLDNSTITGFEEIGVSGFSSTDTSVLASKGRFTGLGASDSNSCVIDGSGGSSFWWNCVGVVSRHYYNGSTGMPGPLLQIASSMHLYIWAPGGSSSFQMGGAIQGTKLSLSTAVTTLAGSDNGSTDATGTSASFTEPYGITTDGTNLYVSDSGNHRIRKIVIDNGTVTTLAGSSDGSTDATGTSASFTNPWGITTDGTNLYVVDRGNHKIRKIVIDNGTVTTLAGSSEGSTDATGTSASFNGPMGITTDGTNLYVSDRGNHRIRKIVISTGVVTTLAGSSSGNTDATGTSASFSYPMGITTDGTNLYVADQSNHRIRKIVISTGVVTTLAGSSSGNTDATGTSASFNGPMGITTDGTNLYVTDQSNHRIRKIVISTGVVTTLAGSSSGNTDATGTSASFNYPIGITTDGTNLYVADQSNHRIRKIE
jgi:hypothetical protein